MKHIELLNNLEKRGFIPFYFENTKEAITKVLNLISIKATIGFGGSMTIAELNLAEQLFNAGHTLYLKGYYDKDDLFLKQHTAEWYLTSTNALTTSGEFINIDGRSNRVGDMANGPINQIFVLGVNKIVDSIEEGIFRTRNISAPKNTVRLNKKTPCAITGKCENCFSPDKICNSTMILHHPTAKRNSYVIIINENLGY